MTTNADGTGFCDRCGVNLPNTGVGYCVAIVGMTTDGNSVTFHLCTFTDQEGVQPCAGSVLDQEALAYLVESGAEVPQFFDQFAPIPEPPDEPPPPDDGDVTVEPGQPGNG